MLAGNGRKGLLVSLSLLFASASIAAPTVSDYNRDVAAPTLSLISDTPHIESYEINQIGEPTNSHLASVAAEFLRPPVDSKSPASLSQPKPLPPVPGAIFLGLAGFLCVSLVRDRRVWLTALAGLLWLGQTGFAALPHLASHIRSKKQIQQSATGGQSLIYVSQLNGSLRSRSDLEGTQYIGLLRHLAGIPATPTSLSLPVTPLSLRVRHYIWRTWQSQLPKEPRLLRRPPLFHSGGLLAMTPDLTSTSLRAKRSNLIDRLPQFAILPPALRLIQAICCSVPKTGQTVPFSPAFIFARLARSPPQLA
jgi:hypothetical protein